MNKIVKLSDTGYFDETAQEFSLIYNFLQGKCPIRRELAFIRFELFIELEKVPIKILNAHDYVVVTFFEDNYEPEPSDYTP
jgi:hypothetical protein